MLFLFGRKHSGHRSGEGGKFCFREHCRKVLAHIFIEHQIPPLSQSGETKEIENVIFEEAKRYLSEPRPML